MRIDAYRLLSEAILLGIGRAWKKTLKKGPYEGNPAKFQRRFLLRLGPVVMVEILEFLSLDLPLVDARKLMARCLLAGARTGWRRAFKHTATPTEDQIKQAVYDGIMLEVNEYFSFDGLVDA